MAAGSSESGKYNRSIQPQPAETDHQLAGGAKKSLQIGRATMFLIWQRGKTRVGALRLGTMQPMSALTCVSWIIFHTIKSSKPFACSGNQLDLKAQCLKAGMS